MDLEIRNLSAWYGQAQALWNIDLSLGQGEVVGVLGRNGAGKTTLLRSIAGLQSKTAGVVAAGGRQLSGLRPHRIALSGIVLLRQGGQLPASLTVLQNLALGQRLARLRGKRGRTVAEIWHWFPMLEPLQNCKAGLLSGGQRQALALAAAFISEPGLLLLDEPSAGLSPPVAKGLFVTIRNLAESGVSVLAVEQYSAWLIGIASRGYLLEIGAVVAEGPLPTLIGTGEGV